MLAVAVLFVFAACASSGSGETSQAGIGIEQRSLALTLGASEKLAYNLPPEAEGQAVTWTSSAPNIARVSNDGTVTAMDYSSRGESRVNSSPATGTANITLRTADGSYQDTIPVTTTAQGMVDILSLPPLKDQFSSHFMVGNIFKATDTRNNAITNQRLIHHYNILTAENDMKPGYISPRRGGYSFANADRMVNSALASGFKVHGHTLLWHQQNAQWMTSMARANKDNALSAMKSYVTDVMTHFKGRIYSWDVLNEAFPDGVSETDDWTKVMRSTGEPNPWFVSIGSDFVYEAFLAARLADPEALLYYNDYNLDNIGKATMVRDMVRDVNARYRQEHPNKSRLLIDGIGMQSHHNLHVSEAQVRRSIDMFRALGVKISISELDVLAQSWGEFRGIGSGPNKSSGSSVTNDGIKDQAWFYNELMELFIENADIIERITWWGVTDSQSWRSGGLPLLFDSRGRAKPAYYRVVEVLNQ